MDPDALRELLVQHARKERPTSAARQRALIGVGSAAAGVGLLGGGSAAAAPVTAWLAGKWMLIGMGAGVLTLGAVEQVRSWAGAEQPTKAVATSVRAADSMVVAAARPPGRNTGELAQRPPTSSALIAPRRPHVGVERKSRAEAPAPAASAVENSRALLEPASASRLARELATLQGARSLLAAGAASRALARLADYSREFPAGTLRAEALALEVEAAALLGDRALVLEREAAFLREFPTSPLVGRVHALAATSR